MRVTTKPCGKDIKAGDVTYHQGHNDHDRHLGMPPMIMIVRCPSPSAATTGTDCGISTRNAAGQKRRQQWHQWVAPLGSRVPRTLRRILA